MNWETGIVHNSRGVNTMSPRSQPPGQGHGSWEWALSQVQHSPVVQGRKGAEAEAGRELSESETGRARSPDEDDSGPISTA